MDPGIILDLFGQFLPRLIVTLLAVMWAGPWIVTKISDLFNYMFLNIPRLIS